MDGRNCRSRINLQKITISNIQKKNLLDHIKNEIPYESCAILFGAKNNQNNIVKKIFLTTNIQKSPQNFTISNKQLIEAYNIAEQENLEIIGIFHSHPNSIAYPSETDKKFMYINPVIWVIYSGIKDEFKAFLLQTDIIEIPIEFL